VIKLNKKGFLQDLQVEKDTPCWLQGVVSEAKGYGVFLLWEKVKLPLLYLIPGENEAESIYQDLRTFARGKVSFLPFREKTSSGNIYQILHQIEKRENFILVSPLKAVFQKVPSLESIKSDTFCIKKGLEIGRDELIRWLVKKGYRAAALVEERGDYSVRGSIVDFYSPLHSNPLRIEFFGDKVESIREFDPSSQRSISKLEEVTLSSRHELYLARKGLSSLYPFIQVVPYPYLVILDEPARSEEKMKNLVRDQNWKDLLKKVRFYISTFPQGTTWMKPRKEFSLNSSPLPFWRGDLDLLSKDIKSWQERGWRINIITPTPGQARRIQELLQERGLNFQLRGSFDPDEPYPLLVTLGDVEKGFILEESGDVIITDADIFRRYRERRKRWTVSPEEKKIKSWSELKEGDYVVHIDYGIGKFKGLVTLNVMGKPEDYFRIDYKGSDRLYVPFSQLDRLHKYLGDSDNPPPIYNLEGGQWELTKRRVRKATREIASSLLHLHSIRKVRPGYSFSPDTEWQLEFEASFPYEETPDQLKATQEVKQDMENLTPMDRLICGDSGYGKTEVAIRASFKAVLDNKQVAVLVPTTILAEQHYRNFSERMADYPVRIETLSRFQSPKEQDKIIRDLREGQIDILIGTHRLLQPDVRFKDLGLVIIDEEQRFGVLQKKKLRELCKTVDVLTLSATPIPRSLYMALMGIFQLSTIFSPPRERQNVETEVTQYDEEIIKQAILREISRGGQVFYLYNRVKDIHLVAEKLKNLLPRVRFAVAHGQMMTARLEKTVRDFLYQRYDVLVCTSIIESGIDMPNVNTLIVENSEQFGLADLYQLRGRVGRGTRKGYAYFLFTPTKALTEQAKRRLQIIHQFKGPGAGFKIAMEDLHIRGAGNLLGKQQHGHILAVGFTLYSQLLSEEIKKLKGEEVKPSFPLHIELGVEARIPSFYVPHPLQRMELYQKVGKIEKEEELLEFKEELRDRFGNLPSPVRNLIHLLHIKLVARDIGICSIRRSYDHQIMVTFSPFYPLSEEKKKKLHNHLSGKIRTFPLDERNLLILKKEEKKDEELLIWLRGFLQKMKDVLI